MAFITGTATDHQDYWDKLIDFLLNDTDLNTAGENWTIVWGSGNEVVLQGPGLSASDEILVGMKLNVDTLNDRYSISLAGCTGLIPTATAFDQHVNSTPDPARVFLEDQNMTYWFTANGRRFIFSALVSTVYQSGYAGFFFPYAFPSQYNYPMFIGGAAGSGTPNVSGQVALDWRDTTNAHSLFPYARYDDDYFYSSAKMLSPEGAWLHASGYPSPDRASVSLGPSDFNEGISGTPASLDFAEPASNGLNYGYDDVRTRLFEAFGGGFLLTPITLCTKSPNDQTYGILDGVFATPGRNNSAENVITANGKDYLTLPNAFRSGFGDFFAVEME